MGPCRPEALLPLAPRWPQHAGKSEPPANPECCSTRSRRSDAAATRATRATTSRRKRRHQGHLSLLGSSLPLGAQVDVDDLTCVPRGLYRQLLLLAKAATVGQHAECIGPQGQRSLRRRDLFLGEPSTSPMGPGGSPKTPTSPLSVSAFLAKSARKFSSEETTDTDFTVESERLPGHARDFLAKSARKFPSEETADVSSAAQSTDLEATGAPRELPAEI